MDYLGDVNWGGAHLERPFLVMVQLGPCPNWTLMVQFGRVNTQLTHLTDTQLTRLTR